MQISVLDQSVAVQGRLHEESIRETMAFARHCEALGFHRFWMAEHHNHDSISGTAPEILMAAVAATTQRIRVGSAGIMLPNYSTFKVAEQFRVLEAIAPGRIDLGVGRAPGTDRRTAFALNPNVDQDSEHFPSNVRDLLAWIEGKPLASGHVFQGLRAFPSGGTAPEVWVLGSSDFGAQVAAHFGLPHSFAHFITDGQGAEEALETYRRNYRPSERHPTPYASLCVWALAADTEQEALRLFSTRECWRMARDRGILLPMVPPEEAMAHPYSEAERGKILQMRTKAIIGTGAQVADRLRELAQRVNAQEIVILTWTYDSQARWHSYDLLAKEFGL
ncbi:MAG: LLM class flavin-dependent oxidoreductase [Betaproteobacteria bacterium]|nr:LLM class flavin-dependent oxidoreductase [Betaproteobacteria bacterium]